jgi:hypothetical protein
MASFDNPRPTAGAKRSVCLDRSAQGRLSEAGTPLASLRSAPDQVPSSKSATEHMPVYMHVAELAFIVCAGTSWGAPGCTSSSDLRSPLLTVSAKSTISQVLRSDKSHGQLTTVPSVTGPAPLHICRVMLLGPDPPALYCPCLFALCQAGSSAELSCTASTEVHASALPHNNATQQSTLPI